MSILYTQLIADIHDPVEVCTATQVVRMPYDEFVCNLVKDMGSITNDRLHAAVGIAGEAGELLDAIKKNWAYGKPIDTVNIIEELGDLEFYITAMRQLIGISRQSVIQQNTDKLAKRYDGGVYTDAAAIARADKAATGETSSSGVYEQVKGEQHQQEIARTKQVNAINLSAEQVAAVDDTAGIITKAPALRPEEAGPTDSHPDPLLP